MIKKNEISRDGKSLEIGFLESETNPENHLQISVAFWKRNGGGGYFYSVSLVKLTDSGFMVEDLFANVQSYKIESAPRFNKNRMIELAANLLEINFKVEEFCNKRGIVNDWK